MTTTPSIEGLPVPYEALLELGLTEEDIQKALASPPEVLAFQADQTPGARFDVGRVQKVLAALGQFRHTKGRWARDGRRLRLGEGLDPWQVVWVIAPVFGWVVFDDEVGSEVRIVRTVWVEVPRKNGKSTISSGLANVLLLADGEIGAEVYAAAASKDQAGRVFEDAKTMCMTSTSAKKKVQTLAGVIKAHRTGGIFRALSKIAETAHGLNVHGAVVDEVHVHAKRDLIDAIETGTGAREQPLIIFITTADEAVEGSIYDEKHTYTRNCANAVVVDPSHYGVVWAAGPKDDPFSEATWRKANPGLGTSPTLSYLRKESNKARTTPTYFPTFCRLHLNLRMRDQARLVDMRQWDEAEGDCDLSLLKGRRAWGGFDLGAVSDISAWWLGVESMRPGVELEMFWRFWLPEDAVEDLMKKTQVPIREWVDAGWITVTEGNVVDYAVIRDAALEDCKPLAMQRVSYDRMFAGQMVQELDAELKRVEITPVAQTFYGSGPAVKELQRLLGSREERRRPQMLHGPNPVARWMASVVEAKNDGQDNLRLVKPDRAKSGSRIDGMSAMVTGLDGYVRHPRKKQYYSYTA